MKYSILVAAAVIAFAAGESVHGATIHVPLDEPTIQAGIDAATHDDIVLVAAGTYQENVDFGGKRIVVTGEGGADVTTLTPATASVPTVRMVTGESAGTELSGFSLEGGQGLCVVEVANDAAPLIQDNIFFDFLSYEANAVVIRCVSAYPTISFNLFYHNRSISCIGVFSGSAAILNNTFDDNSRGFFALVGSGTAKNNIITNSNEYGIAGHFLEQDYNCLWNNNPDYINGAGPGDNSVHAAPLYCGSGTADFTLSSISPCLGAGEEGGDIGALGEGCGEPDPLPPVVESIAIGAPEDNNHVLDHTPEIAWRYFDLQSRALVESEVEAGTDNDWAVAELWQSGSIPAPDTAVEYAGLALENGATYWVRVRVSNGLLWSEWAAASFRMNSPPSVPTPLAPIGHVTVASWCPSLELSNAIDAEGDALAYDFEIYDDPGLTMLVASVDGIAEQTPTTNSGTIPELMTDDEYWWRCRAHDGFEASPWSGAESFVTGAGSRVIRVPVDAPTVQMGIDAAQCDGDTVLVAPGTYIENIDFGGKSVKVVGQFGAAATILQPANSSAVTITIGTGEGPETELSGFTIVGGAGPSVIRVDGSAAPVIRDNVFRDYFSYVQNAVVIACHSSDALITYNVFYDNTCIGCVGIFSETARIVNNTMDRNSQGVWSLSGAGTVKNNIITNSANSGIANNFTLKNYNCVWGNNPDYLATGPGKNSIQVDPLYCDGESHNYGLLETSPCLGTGADGMDMGVFGAGCDPAHPELPSAVTIAVGAPGDYFHLVDHTPEISWNYLDAQSRPHTGSEVEVGTDDDWAVAEMWQTGFMAGQDTSVIYAGLPLSDGVTYWARVRVSNADTSSVWLATPFRMNTPPTVPVLVDPIGQVTLDKRCTDVTVENATDPESDPTTYDFELYTDPALTDLFDSEFGVSAQTNFTSSRVFTGFTPSTEYWWRARASDAVEYSDWSEAESFIASDLTQVIRVPSDYPTIQEGIDAAICEGDTVLVEAGTYTENLDFRGYAAKVISEDGPHATLLFPADPNAATVTMNSGESPLTELNGFTLAGGEGLSVVDIGNGSTPVIRNNVFRDQLSYVQDAVSIACHASDPLITHNVFHDNISIGCIGIFSGTARILHNTFDRNSRGFWTTNGAGVAKNNIVTNSFEFGVARQFSEMDYNCLWNNNPDYALGAAPGTHAVMAYPQYCDPLSQDYTLATNSPCAGTGEDGVTIGALDATCDPGGLNRVTVASKTVPAHADNVDIPIFIQNSTSLSSIQVPLVIREITPGTYITSLAMSYGDRLSPGGPLDDISLKQPYPNPDGLCRTGGFGTIAPADFVSPDGVLFKRMKIFSDPLSPGIDLTGSMILTVGITGTPGSFEIDTTCADPGNHLLFVDDGTGVAHAPAFTKGIITVGNPHVTVESKIVTVGSPATIGVFIANDVDLSGLNIPLVIREVTPGVYPQSMTGYYPAGTRLSGTLTDAIIIKGYVLEDGACKNGQSGGFGTVENYTSGSESFTYTLDNPGSPDAFLFTRTSIASPLLAMGDDGGTASIAIDIIAPDLPGFFIIDTTCVNPSGHITLLGADAIPLAGLTFAAGLIEVSEECNCPYQGDFDADGFLTALDLSELIDELWAGHALMRDPNCPSDRGDLDCDGFVTALDLVRLIDHLFAGNTMLCDPCQSNLN